MSRFLQSNDFRSGFKTTSMILGLVALAFVTSNLLLASGSVTDPSHFGPNSTPLDIVLSKLQSAVFPFLCLVMVALAARPALPALLSQPSRPVLMFAFFALGAAFALVINIPLHNYLIRTFLPQLNDTPVNETTLSHASMVTFLIAQLILIAVLVPISEELIDRGMLFEELKALPSFQIIVWSVIVFSFSHYLVFGIFKVIAVVPMAIVYALIRLRFGSWKYGAATHAGLNAAGILAYIPLSSIWT